MEIVNAAMKSFAVVCAACAGAIALLVCAAWMAKGHAKSGLAIILGGAWAIITWLFYIRT